MMIHHECSTRDYSERVLEQILVPLGTEIHLMRWISGTGRLLVSSVKIGRYQELN
jgi:hypothetical protein